LFVVSVSGAAMSNDICQSKKRATISTTDILQSLDQLDFDYKLELEEYVHAHDILSLPRFPLSFPALPFGRSLPLSGVDGVTASL
jgi:hypothetical protein